MGKKILITLISLILIAAGVMAAYYFYSVSPLASPAPTVQPTQILPSSLVPTDARVTISTDGLTPITLKNRIQSEIDKPQAPGTIEELVLTKTANGQTFVLGGSQALDLMDITPPNILVRSLTQPWMLGIYTDANGEKSIFVMMTTNFFQNAFAGMLQWENVMADDLKQYIYNSDVRGIANAPQSTPLIIATSSKTAATSTKSQTTSTQSEVPIQPFFTIRGTFTDRIIHNKDVREFRTDTGQILFLYSFVSNSELVMTNREQTLDEIIARLDKQAFIR